MNAFPDWLNDLVGVLKEKKDITAETNVQNLPTVNWEDETFYVKFTQYGATLYNKFATIVKEIDGVSTIEEVDKYINDSTVVALKKQANSELPQDPHNNVEEAFEDNEQIEVIEDNQDKVIEELLDEPVSLEEESNELTEELDKLINEDKAPATKEYMENTEPKDVPLPDNNTEFLSLKNEVKELRTLVEDLIAKLNTPQEVNEESNDITFANRLSKLEKKYAELYHAYCDDDVCYDLNCEEEEMKHVNESIDLSQKILDKEHELDLSKQSERGMLNADFLKEILDDFKNNLQDYVEETGDYIEEINDELQDTIEEGIEETKDFIDEVCEEDIDCEEDMEEPENIEEDDDVIILLEDPQAIEEFSEQICPLCHKHELAAIDMKNHHVNVKCASCQKDFDVDLDNNEIYYTK